VATEVDGLTTHHYGSRYEYHYQGVRVIFDWLHPTSDGLKSWVEIHWQGNVPHPRLLAFGRYDLMGSTTVDKLIRGASNALPEENIDWRLLCTAVVYDVVSHSLEGKDPVVLADIELPPQAKWMVKPLVGTTGATSLIAPGGSTKSILALALGLQVATGYDRFLQLPTYVHGPVLYLDWEADAETHTERMRALCAAREVELPQDMWYRNETQALFRSVNSIEKIVDREGIVMVVVDSVMLARSGDAFGPEDTVRMYAALRQIGVPALLVDHKSREAIRKNIKGAYGSVVNDNTARLQWEMTSVQDHGPSIKVTKLEVVKRNNAPMMDPLAFETSFTNKQELTAAIKITQVNPLTVRAIGEAAPLIDQVESQLWFAGSEGVSAPDVARELEKDPAQVRARLADLAKEHRAEKRENRWYAVGRDQQQEIGEGNG